MEKELKLAFVGFGNVARAFARLLEQKKDQLYEKYGFGFRTVSIATARHGCIISKTGIDLLESLNCIEHGGTLLDLPGASEARGSIEAIESCEADLLFETTPLNAVDGEPAITHCRIALKRGINLVTANKGPVAYAYHEMSALAAEHNVSFRFEGTVMDGAPIFNLVERCLPVARVKGFYGVLNSTTNFILTEMERGRSFNDSLAEVRRLGLVEASADYDIDGWDAAVKAIALANVLMDAGTGSREVYREGIRNVTCDQLREAAQEGFAVRLIARATRSPDGLMITVAPERVPAASPPGCVRGTSNVLVIETDLMGELAIFEIDPGIDQTAYALLSDMLGVWEEIRSRQAVRNSAPRS